VTLVSDCNYLSVRIFKLLPQAFEHDRCTVQKVFSHWSLKSDRSRYLLVSRVAQVDSLSDTMEPPRGKLGVSRCMRRLVWVEEPV
jgi:hypothetical protein